MKINHLQISAVIPVQQYGNIQPSIGIDFENTDSIADFKRGEDKAISYISDLFSKYSLGGGLTAKEVIKTLATKRSFNEEGVEILFEPIAHTYHFGGKQLTSATTHTKTFYKPFDEESISSVSAKAWGVAQQDIKDLWNDNRELTSEFGTVVHKALELYTKHQALGQSISDKKGTSSNYAIPKHPILRSIIEGFIAIDKTKGSIVAEALITNVKKGFCGHADRIEIIDLDKKICRIGDYKINVDSEEIDRYNKVLPPLEKLPANKLSKYQIQMSIYANMLQASGWTVEGLDVYIYEDKWKHFEFPVIQII